MEISPTRNTRILNFNNLSEHVKDIEKEMQQENRALCFESLYIAVRQQENRIYTDEELLLLPNTHHTHSDEWRIRKASAKRLVNYLRQQHTNLKILEVGCGNGWLSAMLANIPSANVVGLDANQLEIEQAKRVFKKDNLAFVYNSFGDITFEQQQFDIIVFAASIQYFPSLVDVLNRSLLYLRDGGEIHIIDTPFYNQLAAQNAQMRSAMYYIAMGVPQMAEHYFHHEVSVFNEFKSEIMFNSASLVNRLLKKHPFDWIKVSK